MYRCGAWVHPVMSSEQNSTDRETGKEGWALMTEYHKIKENQTEGKQTMTKYNLRKCVSGKPFWVVDILE